MLYPLVTVEEWCQKHDLRVRKRKCCGCKRMLETNIPFVDQAGYGLISARCPCGNGGTISTRILREDGVLGALGDRLTKVLTYESE